MHMMERRRFLRGIGLLSVAPAIITTPGLLMPIKKPPLIVNAWVGKMVWGSFPEDYNYMVPARIMPEEQLYGDAPVLVSPKDRWGGPRGMLADVIDLVGNDPVAWQYREINQILTEEFGWLPEVRA